MNLKFVIIIPAYNEEEFIGLTLDSLLAQSHPATEIIVVDDNSTDDTPEIVNAYCEKNPTVRLVSKKSENSHLPGSKVIQAFNYGLERVKADYDILCKFDADLIFPENYLEEISDIFENNAKTGMAGGFCYIEQNGSWILENLTGKDHIRGALKSYRKECFEQIGGLKPAMGWDTLDELLAQYKGWEISTSEKLAVKHLKPTGSTYSAKAKYKQGEAFYAMRYGFALTLIASAKLAYRKKSFRHLANYLTGYLRAGSKKHPYLVSREEGVFIRNYRWKKIREKFS